MLKKGDGFKLLFLLQGKSKEDYRSHKPGVAGSTPAPANTGHALIEGLPEKGSTVSCKSGNNTARRTG